MQVLESKENYYYTYMKGKVSGTYKYAADYFVNGSLVGGVLRAGVPHGIIEKIDLSDALKMPGVRAILTHRDVPGLNAFGYFVPQQPVLCKDEVMYEGDAVAAVAADDISTLDMALKNIRMVIREMPAVKSIGESLEGNVKLRKDGNVGYKISYEKGSYESADGEELAGTYSVGAVKPMYIEPESAIAWTENDMLKVIT
ncbi:MAG: hypothetical protein ACP5NC_06490, partial [Nitrososphaeria archaeon]